MLNIEMLMEELEDEVKGHPPPERKRHVERILDDYNPNALIELAEAPEDIQDRIRELDDEKEEIWEWIHEEANLHNVRI
jgi:hypothetical protein